MTVQIQINDRVHARLYNEDRSQVAVQNFVVTAIDGSVYRGGVLDCDISAGWEIELIRKSLVNLNLPTTLSEITVYDKNNKPFLLTGKGEIWRDDRGRLFNLDSVFTWESGHIELPKPPARPVKRLIDL